MKAEPDLADGGVYFCLECQLENQPRHISFQNKQSNAGLVEICAKNAIPVRVNDQIESESSA